MMIHNNAYLGKKDFGEKDLYWHQFCLKIFQVEVRLRRKVSLNVLRYPRCFHFSQLERECNADVNQSENQGYKR